MIKITIYFLFLKNVIVFETKYAFTSIGKIPLVAGGSLDLKFNDIF